MLKAIAVYGSMIIVGAGLIVLSAANLWLKIKFETKDKNYTEIGGRQNEQD